MITDVKGGDVHVLLADSRVKSSLGNVYDYLISIKLQRLQESTSNSQKGSTSEAQSADSSYLRTYK